VAKSFLETNMTQLLKKIMDREKEKKGIVQEIVKERQNNV